MCVRACVAQLVYSSFVAQFGDLGLGSRVLVCGVWGVGCGVCGVGCGDDLAVSCERVL